MNLQVIKSVNGKAEYVLLPIDIYDALHDQIKGKLKAKIKTIESKSEYVSFEPSDYVDNPIALARINAGITQETLAKRMKVSQAYISKIEKQDKVTPKLLKKVKAVLGK